MNRSCVALAAALILAAPLAHAGLPAFWRETCEAETGRFVYERPPAAGLADPDRIGHGAADLLLGSGALSLEVSYLRGLPIPAIEALYNQGPGRYQVRLTRNVEPACAQMLAIWGYNPVTLARVGAPGTGARLDGNALDGACLSAVRTGEPAKMRFQFAPADEAAFLAQYSAPFHIRKIKSRHPRATDNIVMFREATQVVDSVNGRVIAEEINLMYYTSNYFRPVVSCGPAKEQFPSAWRLPVFQRARP